MHKNMILTSHFTISQEYSEFLEELEIMTILRNHLKQANEKMVSAKELSLETDSSSQTIAWKCKRLDEAGLIKRHTNYTPYRYALF